MINEGVLFEQKTSAYAGVFSKINIYNRRERMSLNESKYFGNRFAYNPDILFNLKEQDAIGCMFRTIKAHLEEQMQSEIDAYKTYLINEGWMDKAGKALSSVKDKISAKLDAIANKFSAGIKLVTQLIKKGVNSVKEFMAAIGQLFAKFANLDEAIEKLGGFKKDESAEAENEGVVKVNDKFTDGLGDGRSSFFAKVATYVQEMMTKNSAAAKQMINEGFVDAIANNKWMQFIIGHRKGKQWGFWHTILVSLVGSLIIAFVIPPFLMMCGVSAPTIIFVCTCIRIVWSLRGLVKVLLNRYLNKKSGESYWKSWSLWICIFMATVPLAVFQIPEVKEFMNNMFRSLFEFLHIDKALDALEEWLDKIVKHFTGHHMMEVKDIPGEQKWIEDQVESIRHAGGNTTDLLQGAHADNAAYISKIGSEIANYEGGSEGVVELMKNVAKQGFKSSVKIDDFIVDTGLSADDPLSVLVDGNTFGNVSRSVMQKACEQASQEYGIESTLMNFSEDVARETSNGWYGTAYGIVFNANPTEENAALAKAYLERVAELVHVAKPHGDNVNVFGRVLNDIIKVGGHWEPGEVQHEFIHKLFDTTVACFGPVFWPWFNPKMFGEYQISLGSNASGRPAYTVVDVQQMSLDKVKEISPDNKALALLLKHMEDIQKQHKDDIKSAAEEEKKDNNGKISNKNKGFFKHEIKKYNDNNKVENKKICVFFVDRNYIGKDKDDKKVKKVQKHVPILGIDPNTMMCFDIAPWDKRARKQPYFMRGLMARLDFIPVAKNDNDVKEFIHNTLRTCMETAVKQCVSYSSASMYVKKTKDGYVPSDETTKDTRAFDCGNLTPQEICDVLNKKLDAYTLLDGKNADDMHMRIDKDGNLKKHAKESKKVIEKLRYVKNDDGTFTEDANGEYDFVDAKIIPFINRPDSEVYKELHDDKDVAELLFDDTEDGEDTTMNTNIFYDEDLNLKQFLYRPLKTFPREDKVKLAEGVNKYLKGKSKKEKKHAYDTIKSMIEIIWNNIRKNVRRALDLKKGKKAKKDEQ